MLHLVFHDETLRPPDRTDVVNAWRDEQGNVFAQAFRTQVGYRLDWAGIGTMAFSPRVSEVQIWPESGLPLALVEDRFTRIAQPLVIQALGGLAVHASATCGPSGVIAFCGVSGSGKSTMAFALGQRPHHTQVADDALVIDVTTSPVRAVPLPFRARLRPPAEAALAATPMDVRQPQPAPLAAVFVLSQDVEVGAPAIARRLAGPSAFTSLLAHAHAFDVQEAEAQSKLVQDYLRLAEHVPVFALSYAPTFSGLSDRLDMVTDLVAASARPIDAIPS